MVKWDYKVIAGYNKDGIISGTELGKRLKEHGAEGWEFVASITAGSGKQKKGEPYLIFKRQIEHKR
jgi:hypothetical protein